MTIFEAVNTHLQLQAPLIHKLRRIVLDLCKDILTKFMRPEAIAAAHDLLTVNCEEQSLHKSHSELIIGTATRAALVKLQEGAQQEVYENIINFYISAFQYLTKKLPCLHEPMYKHCEVADVKLRVSAKFSSILYFVENHSCLLKKEGTKDHVSLDILQTEFANYQTAVELPEVDRIDIQWHLISEVQDTLGKYRYRHLCRVMSAILAIPHSNADCERVFSLVQKTRTEARSCMSNATLESLLIQKITAVHDGPCHSQHFSTEVIRNAKSATKLSLTSAVSSSTAINSTDSID
jgi:hypothetical protein